MPRSQLFGLSLFSVLGFFISNTDAAALLDDRAVTIGAEKELTPRRQGLIAYLWGEAGFPSTQLPDKVITNVPSPVKQLEALARVDELRVRLAPDLEGLAYHFVPRQPNSQLVVVHHGHGCTLDSDLSEKDVGYGLGRTIQFLLREGYGVLAVFMPHMRPGDCTGDHEKILEQHTTGSPIKFFLESTAFSLNYLTTRSDAGQFPKYRKCHMIGLSGGGWTTTVYAAVDPRIRCSVSVAGTIPLYLRSGGSVGDREQFEPSFYRLAGYPDLYLLGACGSGRRQVQLVIRRDDCCFGQAQHDSKACGLNYDQAMVQFEQTTRRGLERIGPGSFRVVIDETAPSHMISHYAIKDVLLPELLRAN